jgi:hypothetical protein
MRVHRKTLWVLALAVAILLGACNVQPTPGTTPVPTATATPLPTSTATPTPEVLEDVVVERIELQILESFPVQVRVAISGQLPDACSLIEEARQTREGNTFQITLKIARRPDARCAPNPTPFEHVVPLEVLGLPAGRYTVNVHGVSGTFELTVPNDPIDASAIGGRVWHDLCALAGGEGGVPLSPSAGCVPDGSGGYRANGILEAGEPGIAGVLVTLGGGECPSTGLATATTGADGSYTFTDLTPGTYCVAVDPLEEPNASILLPGDWTAPAVGEGSITVTLGPGMQRTDVDFGWDYQFLPADALAEFEARLMHALLTRDYALMRQMMSNPFGIAPWRSEGTFQAPDAAIEQLRANYIGPDTPLAFERDENLTLLLGGMDPRSLFGPDTKAVDLLYAKGWGMDGRDEALLYVVPSADGGYEWYAALIAPGGFAQASGLALTWYREGGIAGFCDGLAVSANGDVLAGSCRGGGSQELRRGRLEGDRLAQVQTWVSELRPFERVWQDDAVADAMTVRLSFFGAGSSEATPAQTEAMQQFAAQLYAELTSMQLQGGILATFDVVGEQFRVWITNPQTVQQVLDLEAGRSDANIPNGRILRGPGAGDHNAPWSWHLDPEQIEMAEMTVEVCDGTPSYVEEHLDEFVDTVERYCPWSAQLVDVQDLR